MLFFWHFAGIAFGQTNTVGLLFYDTTKAFAGYTLFTPLKSTKTYLINMNGMLVHSWNSSYQPGQSVMLLSDGNLLRTAMVGAGNHFVQGGVGGRVELFDWNGNLIWYFEHFGNLYSTHHDIEYMPNGNILMIAWEKKTLAEVVAAGRDTAKATYAEVWSEKIIEVQPDKVSGGGTIIWEWHIWDHLVQDFDSSKANYGIVSSRPGLFNINYGDKKVDWLHFNSIRYNSDRDEIMVSVHAIHEFWIIDHSTTTAQAAGHSGGNRGKGGDLLYRWGNPLAYKLGTATNQKLYSQHDARWIDNGLQGAGNILIFNNGTKRPGRVYSSIEEIIPPLATDGSYIREQDSAYGPSVTAWSFVANPDTSFYAENISGATRLQNGNSLICEGPKGKFFEVDSSKQIVWTYMNPVAARIFSQGETPTDNMVFKIYRYAPTYSGLSGKVLTPVGPIELPSAIENDVSSIGDFKLYQNYPNPFNPETSIRYDVPKTGNVLLKVFDTMGREVATLVNDFQQQGTYTVSFNADKFSIPSGIYYYRITIGGFSKCVKMICLK